MKSTQHFTEAIKAYLDKRAADDAVFAEKYANEKKSVEECCTYILNEVKKSGYNAYMPEEIYGMAVHYYDEADIDAGKPVENVRVVVTAPSGSPKGGESYEGRELRGDKRKGDRATRRKGDKPKERQEKVAETSKPEVVQGSLF